MGVRYRTDDGARVAGYFRQESHHAHNFSTAATTDDKTDTTDKANNRVLAMMQALRSPGNPSAQDYAFIALQNAYRPHAGLMRMHNLAACGTIWAEGQDRKVQDLVDTGQLFGFQWNDAFWIPLFQLDMPGPTVAHGPKRVLAKWGRPVDGWALARWFVQPHVRLASRSPIECLGENLPDVLAVAHADRCNTH